MSWIEMILVALGFSGVVLLIVGALFGGRRG